jgi:hypothetical protein
MDTENVIKTGKITWKCHYKCETHVINTTKNRKNEKNFRIFSLFNFLFFHIFNIFSLFNLPFFQFRVFILTMSFSSALIVCFASTYSCRFRMFTLRFNYQYSYRNMQLKFFVSALNSLHSWATMDGKVCYRKWRHWKSRDRKWRDRKWRQSCDRKGCQSRDRKWRHNKKWRHFPRAFLLLRFTVSDYSFGIFWSLCCLSFELRLLLIPLESSSYSRKGHFVLLL